MAAPPIVITDFDGTLTDLDVGDALCELYADGFYQTRGATDGSPQTWLEIDRSFVRGELSLPEAQRRIWSLVRAPLPQLVARALQIARLRSGVEALFDAAAHGAIELVIASGGFDFYIEPLLGERMRHLKAAYYNRARSSAQGIELIFPHVDLACLRCAVCKGKAVSKHYDNTRRLLFCGDGTSDHCATAKAGELFAIAGSNLAQHCEASSIPHTPFTDFHEVLATL